MAQQYDPDKPEDLKRLRIFALRELKRQRDPDDIIGQLCGQTNWDWNEAQGFLNEVGAENAPTLAARQN